MITFVVQVVRALPEAVLLFRVPLFLVLVIQVQLEPAQEFLSGSLMYPVLLPEEQLFRDCRVLQAYLRVLPAELYEAYGSSSCLFYGLYPALPGRIHTYLLLRTVVV
jgi:hypothetical protein